MDPPLEIVRASAVSPQEVPLTVREAAVYLGVSSQTVYLWVERKQIPHLRVMGRNIRFLKADLEQFRAGFRLPTTTALGMGSVHSSEDAFQSPSLAQERV